MILGVRKPFRAGFGVAIDGGMREVARLAQLGDVPLSGLFRDAERSGGFEVGCTVEGTKTFWWNSGPRLYRLLWRLFPT